MPEIQNMHTIKRRNKPRNHKASEGKRSFHTEFRLISFILPPLGFTKNSTGMLWRNGLLHAHENTATLRNKSVRSLFEGSKLFPMRSAADTICKQRAVLVFSH